MLLALTTTNDNRLTTNLQLRQHNPFLRLIFAFAVGIAGLADFVRLKEQNLTQAFVGINTRRQRRGVGDFERDEAFPLRLERRDVDDDAAAGIRALTHTDGQHVAEF